MSSKKRRPKSQQSRRAAQKKKAKSQKRTLLLIGGVVAAAIAIVGLIALASRPDAGSGTPEPVSLDKSMGSETAPVVVTEYGDFQCPACRAFAQGPKVQLGEEYVGTGQVRFVFRHFAFIGNESTWAAEASECANEQGQFWQYHDKLFQEQGAENSGALSKDNLKRFAAELGLDTAEFNECLDSGEYTDKVREEVRDATNRRLTGTPSIFVDGRLVPNGSIYQVLKTAVDAALAD